MDMQIVMLTLSLTGLIIGMVVDERLRAEQKLRDSLQLIAAGELAGALAHELHQPMSALSAYSESAMMLLHEADRDPSRLDKAKEVLTKVVSETLRASDIVRGLRSYFIGGASNLQKVSARKIVEDCVERSLQKNADKAGVTLRKNLSTKTMRCWSMWCNSTQPSVTCSKTRWMHLMLACRCSFVWPTRRTIS